DDRHHLPVALQPRREQQAPARRVGRTGLDPDDAVLPEQRVVVPDHPGDRDGRLGKRDELRERRYGQRPFGQPELVRGRAHGRPAASVAYAAASCAETVSAGPSSAGRSGWSRSTRYAVITLATLAMGTGRTAPEEPRLPSPATSTVAWPVAGQGSTGGVPAMV